MEAGAGGAGRDVAELKVGALEEALTVTGASPVVDVQSNVKTQVLSRDVLDAVPSAVYLTAGGRSPRQTC